MIECNWTPSYTLAVPTNWTTGSTSSSSQRLDGTQLQNWMTFVVRDDSSTAPVVYSFDINTWQAYNFWGGSGNNNLGISLYGRFNDVTWQRQRSRAYTVSFDRPTWSRARRRRGQLHVWDFPMVKWMESQGYDMTYVTDIDLQSNPNLLHGHRVIVNTGHDEYYSDRMRSAASRTASRAARTSRSSAQTTSTRITWSADARG